MSVVNTEKNGINVKKLLKEAKKLILSSGSEEVDKGLKTLKKIIKADPENLWAFLYYGVGASKSEKHRPEAVPAFETASHIHPDSVECWKGIRACLETRISNQRESRLLMEAYSNLLRIEYNMDKWTVLYSDIMKASFANLPVSLVASLLSSLIEDWSCKALKHETSCKDLSTLVFTQDSLLETNMEDVLKAFQGWANFLDFSDRPEFCKKVCSFLSKFNYYNGLSSFLHHTLLVYGPKLYPKILLVQYVVEISYDSLDNVEKLIPLVKKSLKEVENVKGFDQIKLALCIVDFFEHDFTKVRQHLESLSCTGDVNSTLFLLKFLCKAKDYDTVLFLCVRFAKMFATLNNDKLKLEFVVCLLEALSSCNEVMLLEHAVRLGLKSISKFGENGHLVYCLSHSYLGLEDPKAVFYLNKLGLNYKEDFDYIMALLKHDRPKILLDSGKWLPSSMLSANYDLIEGNMKRAIKQYIKIGVKDNCISEPFLVLGVDSLAKGNIDKAVSCFHRAFSLCPLDVDILKRFLDSLFKLNEDEQALQILDSVCSSNFGKWHLIGEKALLASGLIHSAKYDHEKSIRSFKHLIKLKPDRMEFVECISDEYIRLGRLGIAESYVSRLVSDDPYNLHPLLLLCEIYKLDVNYSAYYNEALRCINFCPEETKEALKTTRLILSFYINFINQSVKLETSSHQYISRLCECAIKRIHYVVEKGNLARSCDNEYLIAIYKFVESHFLAAVKLMKLKDGSLECKELIGMCIKAIDKVIRIYGTNLICFWKLLGDILLHSSRLHFEIEVSSWLMNGLNISPNHSDFVKVLSLDRLYASLKCYATALNLASSQGSGRLYEFYYDISVALVYLANHADFEDPFLKHSALKASLQSCLESFVHSDGISNSRWIHSNLLGVIVSLLGVRENMFKVHFSGLELQMKEGLMLQNYATHLSKNGLYTHAEDTFEQTRLRVDMDYSSSWVGQLVMQLINNDMETKKMLEYNLTQIGNHPLLKWALAYYLSSNKPGFNFHGDQYSLLNCAFSEEQCVLERNPSRLTLMACIHELIGNVSLARRLYFRVLRLAKHADGETYNNFLSNAIRMNSYCKLNYNLVELLDSEFSSYASVSLYGICSNHISVLTPNTAVFFKTLVIMKNLLGTLSSRDQIPLVLVIPLLNVLGDLNLCRFVDSKLPFIIEYLIKNTFVLLNTRRKELKQIISVMDSSNRAAFTKHVKKFVSTRKFCRSAYSRKGLISQICLPDVTGKRDGVNLTSHGSNAEVSGVDTSSTEENEPSTSVGRDRTVSLSLEEPCPYSKVLTKLRTVFPLPLTDQEKLIIKRNKILNLRAINSAQPEVITFEKDCGSYLDLMEHHGCHSNCTVVFSLLQNSVSSKRFDYAVKYANLCLSLKCSSCIRLSNILPLVCVISLETKNIRLIQKAVHLYPEHPLLRKTALLLFTKICGQ